MLRFDGEHQLQFVSSAPFNMLHVQKLLRATARIWNINILLGCWRSNQQTANCTHYRISHEVFLLFFFYQKRKSDIIIRCWMLCACGAETVAAQVNRIKYIFPFCLRHGSQAETNKLKKYSFYFLESVCFLCTTEMTSGDECRCWLLVTRNARHELNRRKRESIQM